MNSIFWDLIEFCSEKQKISQTKIDGKLKVTVELVAGLIEGEGKLNLTEQEKKITNETTFQIYGTLKQTIFATSFMELRNLTQKIRTHPDEYLSETPQLRVFFVEVLDVQ